MDKVTKVNKVTSLIKKNRVLISFVFGMIFSSAIADTDAGIWLYGNTHDAMAAFSDQFFEPEKKTLAQKMAFWRG